MKIIYLLLMFFTVESFATDAELMSVDINVHDKKALQRGAKMYMNYCSGCHSLKYLRYNRMAKDLGLTTFTGELDKDLLINNLIFTKAAVHDPIAISMNQADARQWFGRVPPDLSLSARERGRDWIYTYLSSFYVDNSRPFGANNLLVRDVSMPNVLAPLEGTVIASGEDSRQLILVERGQMTQHQFDSALQDLVTFLTYVSEPVQLERYYLGVWVIGFLLIFLLLSFLLKRIYWKRL